MNDRRNVQMTAEQYEAIEELIELEMRASNERRAYLLMNLSLQYRFARPAAVTPTNVIPFPDRHSVRVG